MSPTHHDPGTFCWSELVTSDATGAKEFYSRLMGWETEDDPIPGGGVYTMIRLAGGNVGALYEQSEEMRSEGVQPTWLSYVTVEDAVATTARARELGGSVMKDASDVFDIGSMAVLRDPTGAPFAIWQPKRHTGTDHTDGKPGSVTWHELTTRDSEAAAAFYAGLFGWEAHSMEMPGGHRYTLFMSGERQRAGMIQMTEEWGDAPSHWMVYFSVADCDASAALAGELGGQVCVPPTDVEGVGRFAVVNDPQGGFFSIVKLVAPAEQGAGE